MAVVKVLEIMAESPEGWEAAVQEAVRETAKTVRGIQNVWVQDFKAIVEGDRIVAYRANCKISFTVENT
jgi:flavin-binding protein dodecin